MGLFYISGQSSLRFLAIQSLSGMGVVLQNGIFGLLPFLFLCVYIMLSTCVLFMKHLCVRMCSYLCLFMFLVLFFGIACFVVFLYLSYFNVIILIPSCILRRDRKGVVVDWRLRKEALEGVGEEEMI